MEPAFPSMGHRAWFAWQCLPRNDRGEPPSWRELEERHGLSNGSINKIVWDVSTRPSFEQLERVALALNTTPQWLRSGAGDSPVARMPVPARPAEPKKTGKSSKRSVGGRGLPRSTERAFSREAKQLVDRTDSPRSGNARK